jgi:hypothetical protein
MKRIQFVISALILLIPILLIAGGKKIGEEQSKITLEGDFEDIGINSIRNPIDAFLLQDFIMAEFNKNLGIVQISITDKNEKTFIELSVDTSIKSVEYIQLWGLAPGQYTIVFRNSSGMMYGEFNIF